MRSTKAKLGSAFLCISVLALQSLALRAQSPTASFFSAAPVQQTADTALQQGRRLLRRGQGDQALGYLETALRLYAAARSSRGVAAAHNELGDLYLRQGQYKVALDHYQKAYEAFTGASNQDQKEGSTATTATSRVAGSTAAAATQTAANISDNGFNANLML